MKKYPDKWFDFTVCDPPYGININMNMGRRKGEKKKYKDKKWDNEIPQKEYFDELFRVSKNQIIWGGNYFTDFLSPTKSWLFWDKQVPAGVSFADGELAWTSYNKTLIKVTIPYSGFTGKDKDVRMHPTQKPIALYDWLIKNYAKQGDKILDTHLGSGSSRIACEKGGFNFIGFEIDTDYYEKQEKRFKNHIAQARLF